VFLIMVLIVILQLYGEFLPDIFAGQLGGGHLPRRYLLIDDVMGTS